MTPRVRSIIRTLVSRYRTPQAATLKLDCEPDPTTYFLTIWRYGRCRLNEKKKKKKKKAEDADGEPGQGNSCSIRIRGWPGKSRRRSRRLAFTPPKSVLTPSAAKKDKSPSVSDSGHNSGQALQIHKKHGLILVLGLDALTLPSAIEEAVDKVMNTGSWEEMRTPAAGVPSPPFPSTSRNKRKASKMKVPSMATPILKVLALPLPSRTFVIVVLPAFQLLQALLLKPDHWKYGQRQAHKMWSQYLRRMVLRAATLPRSPRSPLNQPPLPSLQTF
ncbi:MAG: hypothetical protein Q9200_004535 [Gallowayella weberi]